MPEMYVNIESLNFRSSPSSAEDNIIGKLYLTQKVMVGDTLSEGWVECRAPVDGDNRNGFVSAKFLRQPLTPNREKLIASVHKQYMRFERGLGKEHISPFSGFVGEMWRSVGNNNLDGTDRDNPWSAAAISFMVKKAGDAYDNFRFASAHSKFIHHAIKARRDGDTSAPFWGYRLHEVRPEIGDIVGRDNPEFSPVVTFDIAEQIDAYRSHSDIVVRIDTENNKLIGIGGNVSDSVGTATYDLAPGDFLSSSRNAFVILKNIADGAPADV
ncbi:DUF2272 domain-containing protein [Rhizobium leguminosarum]|uniref:DUF2272 domain-containing protein n=1 Tax=Rhizobium leguminosarum TaxID=384 RepID=UPI001C97A451|nr:DUF2272 domain-containing protein [Rhizobium leguminosarum]MBY5814345.1 DUF2272 domain-containing protein [Rhizobium leguminosarum]